MISPAQNSTERRTPISSDVEKTVQIPLRNRDDYRHDKIYTKANQIVDPSSPLRDIDGTHCPGPVESFRNYKYDYVLCMMTEYPSRSVNPDGQAYASAVQNTYGKKWLKDGYGMIMLDRPDSPCSV